MRIKLSDLLELLGLVALLIAAEAFDWRALVALTGVLLIVAGYLIGAPSDDDDAGGAR